MMSRDQRRRVWLLMAVILVVVIPVLSEVLRPGHEEYLKAARAVKPGDVRAGEVAKTVVRDTPFEALVPTLFGVREVMASLMWVRADDYFHRGEYRPIIRMVRQITTIDPHQLDVYATGAWHMAYNFMDKRLIEDGVEFLQEGTRNNDTVYDLFFELGYMHYDKTKRYQHAVEAYRQAAERGTTSGKKTPPSYVRHQLAHALEKMGDIDTCLTQWEENIRIAESLAKEGEVQFGAAGLNVAAARHNRYITARRMNERLAALAERQRDQAGAVRLWKANVELAESWLRQFPGHPDVTKDLQVAQNTVARLSGGRLAAVEPTNVQFSYTVHRMAPRLLEVRGSVDVLNLSRVRITFRDRDYDERARNGFDFKMDNCTLEWDNVPVNKGQFKFEIKLNRDPADMGRQPEEIYPLKAAEYELNLTYNPRLQAAFIQDRYGWHGEGLTSRPELLKLNDELAGIMLGRRYPLRTVSESIYIKREDVLAQGKKLLYKSP